MRKRELETARLDTMAFAHMIREETEHTFDRDRPGAAGRAGADADELRQRAGARQRRGAPAAERPHLRHPAAGGAVPARHDRNDRQFVERGRRAGRAARRPGVLQGVRQRRDGGAVHRQAGARRPSGGWTLHIARSFTGTDGKFRGVAVAAMDVRPAGSVYQSMKADHPRPMSLYLADGTLVASLPHRENLIGEYAPELGNRPLPAPGDEVRMLDHATGDGGRHAFALGRTGALSAAGGRAQRGGAGAGRVARKLHRRGGRRRPGLRLHRHRRGAAGARA